MEIYRVICLSGCHTAEHAAEEPDAVGFIETESHELNLILGLLHLLD